MYADILLIGIAVSLVILMPYANYYQLPEDSVYEKAMLVSSLEKTYGKYNATLMHGLSDYMCGPGGDVSNQLSNAFNETIKDGYDYIFFAASQQKFLDVYNNQSSVCSKDMQLARIGICKDANATLGIWPAWKNLPPACP